MSVKKLFLNGFKSIQYDVFVEKLYLYRFFILIIFQVFYFELQHTVLISS